MKTWVAPVIDEVKINLTEFTPDQGEGCDNVWKHDDATNMWYSGFAS